MIVGIDVGGTYTDGVALDQGRVVAKAKVVTKKNLPETFAEVLAKLIAQHNQPIKRVVLSTTLITNLVAERKYDRAAALLLPGAGMDYEKINFPFPVKVVSGMVDFRGRVLEEINEKEVEQALQEFLAQGFRKVALVGKFSVRNPELERKLYQIVKKINPQIKTALGHKTGGRLNYLRRIYTSVLYLMIKDEFNRFVEELKVIFYALKIPLNVVFIMKGDGGIVPLLEVERYPLATLYSGPAASALGAYALCNCQNIVVLDIGGTTTDIALVLNQRPLLSHKGADIGEFLTSVPSLAVTSVPFGGDTAVTVLDGEITFTGQRQGPAYCLGGPAVTVTDALRFLNLIDYGDFQRAKRGIHKLAQETGLTSLDVAQKIVDIFTDTVVQEVKNTFKRWENEPRYRIYEIMTGKKFEPELLSGVGGGAYPLTLLIAKKLGMKGVIYENYEVANALGAALARDNLSITVYIDTEQKYVAIPEWGYKEAIPKLKNYSEDEVKEFALFVFRIGAKRMNLRYPPGSEELIYFEQFNVVRDMVTENKIFILEIAVPAGILRPVEGRILYE
ncbi:hydantoinase/oxoprolinase family protein [Carboxydothermus hydrogenoformans]|uniref:Hydantoinase/oxoprolinase family protein n=1 Tax=Carboxydothermus hydrogenoformans (strain ATCC BAA-161 / DSM 6008 / Z-2901) TaxID=246194 RepID=Q3AFF0_CARHZ|nr:hydantoinase/oxoprolinase family protein [Carboxydothermus hydrogenoformans]ABB14721.1 hydantoinase/oxoprolinase family protein [Carboxydothermus hydrogenoformans Z-2901]